MAKGAKVWWGEVDEDGSFSALNRVTSLDGTGLEVARGEGPLLKQADVTSISCKVFDIGDDPDAETGTEVTPAPTLTPAANVFDALRTAGWDYDLHGYNFRHDVGPSYLADPGEWRLIEYKFVLASGGPVWIEWRVKTVGKATS